MNETVSNPDSISSWTPLIVGVFSVIGTMVVSYFVNVLSKKTDSAKDTIITEKTQKIKNLETELKEQTEAHQAAQVVIQSLKEVRANFAKQREAIRQANMAFGIYENHFERLFEGDQEHLEPIREMHTLLKSILVEAS